MTTLALTFIMTAVVFLLWEMRHREIEHSRLETVRLTEMFAKLVRQDFETTDLVLKGVQDRLQSSFGRQFSLDSWQTHLMLVSRTNGTKNMDAFFIVNAAGDVVNSSRESTPVLNVADRPYFSTFAHSGFDGMHVGRPTRSRVDQQWIVYMSRKIVNQNGKFQGVVVGALNIPKLEKFYEFMQLDYPRPISIYVDDGSILASIPHREGLIGVHAPELENEPAMRAGETVRLTQHRRGDGGGEEFALARLEPYPLMVSVTNDKEEALMSWREIAIPIALGAITLCLIISISAWMLADKLKRESALEQSLHQANLRYHRTVDSQMDAIVTFDSDLRIMIFNPAAEKTFGYSASEVVGKNLDMLIPQRYRSKHHHHVERYKSQKDSPRRMGFQMGIFALHKNGSEFPIESTISQSDLDEKVQFTVVLRDVTERRKAENELQVLNQQLRHLSAAQEDVREAERLRISRELHDDLGQQLTGLKLDLSWLSKRIKENREWPIEVLDDVRVKLDNSIGSVRRISTELRPPILDDLGLGEALRWQAEEVTKRSTLKVDLSLKGDGLISNGSMATGLFRIVQESLTNCLRHSAATHVAITLEATATDLMLTVFDNGQGFDVREHTSGIGLVSMRERATAMGGKLQIESRTGHGTTIRVSLKWNAEGPLGETA